MFYSKNVHVLWMITSRDFLDDALVELLGFDMFDTLICCHNSMQAVMSTNTIYRYMAIKGW